MARVMCLLMAGIVLSGLSGCQSMPWQKDTMPPVELLDETKAASAEETTPPATTTTTTTAEKPALQMSRTSAFRTPLPRRRRKTWSVPMFMNRACNWAAWCTPCAHRNEIAFYIDKCARGGLETDHQAGGRRRGTAVPEGRQEFEVSVISRCFAQRLVLHPVPTA